MNISGPADKKIKWGSKLLVHNWQLTLATGKVIITGKVISPGVQYNRRNKPEKRRGSYRIRMVAKHVLSAGNGRGKDPAARSLPDQQFFSLSRSMNSKEATRSNSKLVRPSDCQDGDDGVKLELRSVSIRTMNRIQNYLATP